MQTLPEDQDSHGYRAGEPVQRRRIALAGDWHGVESVAINAIWQARDAGCDLLCQLGDFGFIFRKDTTRYLVPTLEKAKVDLIWLGGNHENWEELDKLEKSAPRGKFGFEVAPRIEYLGRSNAFEIDGVTFATLSGAISVDQDSRTPFISWWPREETTIEDVEALPEATVLLMHDAPHTPELEEWLRSWDGVFPQRLEHASYVHRTLMSMAVDRVKPKLVCHGHYHKSIRATYNEIVPVIGLNIGECVALDLMRF